MKYTIRTALFRIPIKQSYRLLVEQQGKYIGLKIKKSGRNRDILHRGHLFIK